MYIKPARGIDYAHFLITFKPQSPQICILNFGLVTALYTFSLFAIWWTWQGSDPADLQ